MDPQKSHYYYNKDLGQYAQKLRNTMTKAEACLWKYALKTKKSEGFQFRRQRPVGKYIADFISLPLKLIIEVDGETHNIESVALRDKVRQQELESMGFHFLRFTDDEVLKNMDGVIVVINNTIKKLLVL
jgi:very-short-patch-repair endonuclease